MSIGGHPGVVYKIKVSVSDPTEGVTLIGEGADGKALEIQLTGDIDENYYPVGANGTVHVRISGGGKPYSGSKVSSAS
jgi:hypothetical protein